MRLCDVRLHFLGPGRPFASETYTIACLISFDRPVAAYDVAATDSGSAGGRASVAWLSASLTRRLPS